MERTDFNFQSSDGTDIKVYHWETPEINPHGIIQIAHGMAEHALRYEPFAKWITKQGFIVYANDHRGHGGSYATKKDKGFFAKRGGFSKVVEDLQKITSIIQKQHPNLPIFLLGHSMGSFLIRRYIQIDASGITGAILSGTGGDQKLIGKIGLSLAKIEQKIKGPHALSPMMDKLIFGNYNKNFSPARTKFDFLSRDNDVVDKYIADENCGFICTTSFYVDLLAGLALIHRNEEIAKTPKHLPIFLLAGDMDPVGDEGKGVQAVYEQYVEHGCENVSLKLYEDGRHEMLNELNRDEVFQDIANWLESILKGDQHVE